MIEYQLYFEQSLKPPQIIRLNATAQAAGVEVVGDVADVFTVQAATGAQVACFTTAVQILVVNGDLPKVAFGQEGQRHA